MDEQITTKRGITHLVGEYIRFRAEKSGYDVGKYEKLAWKHLLPRVGELLLDEAEDVCDTVDDELHRHRKRHLDEPGT